MLIVHCHTGFFYFPTDGDEEVEESGQGGKGDDHASGNTRGHDEAKALNATVLANDQAAEPGDRGQTGDDDGFASASGQDARVLFFFEAVEDMDAVSDPDSNDERQHDDVGRVERHTAEVHQT